VQQLQFLSFFFLVVVTVLALLFGNQLFGGDEQSSNACFSRFMKRQPFLHPLSLPFTNIITASIVLSHFTFLASSPPKQRTSMHEVFSSTLLYPFFFVHCILVPLCRATLSCSPSPPPLWPSTMLGGGSRCW
jgi:hypothetical protein